MQTGCSEILSRPIEDSVRARGATPEAVWLDKERALENGLRRSDAIFRMIGEEPGLTILDLGCGPGFAVGYLEERLGPLHDRYCGIDVSQMLIEAARNLWPKYEFVVRDIIDDPLPEYAFDYTAINGVLTAKYTLSQQEMEGFACRLLEAAWRSTKTALSFNVMSPYVDWTREDLFHWPLERAAAFCAARLSRHFNIIADYGLYEYTVQIFRQPAVKGRAMPRGWLAASNG